MPKWGNRKVIGLCDFLCPKITAEIRFTKDDAHAKKLLRKLIQQADRSDFPAEMRGEYVERLERILEYANE